MTDVADIQPLMEKAEEAAHRGDFAAAGEALRLAVELQERMLGASSPEVASTLNNLGVVYERLERPADAESCYRKSFAIAKAAFASDHPLVETSTTNLREFCNARGIPFGQPEPAPVSVPAEIRPAVPPSPPPREMSPEPVAATSSGSSRRPIVFGAAIVLAVVAGIFFWPHRAMAPVPSPAPSSVAVPPTPIVKPEAAAPTPAPAVATPVGPPAVAREPASKPPGPPVAPGAVAPKAAAPKAVAPKAAPPKAAPVQTAPRAAVVEALDSRLCQSLDLQANWRCDPLPESAVSGPVFFVTRLKSAADTSVEHRWYRNDRLSQSVTLHVPATGSGYRTYSRMTINQDRAGTWRVEVLGPGGAVIDQKTFVVGPS